MIGLVPRGTAIKVSRSSSGYPGVSGGWRGEGHLPGVMRRTGPLAGSREVAIVGVRCACDARAMRVRSVRGAWAADDPSPTFAPSGSSSQSSHLLKLVSED